jgi:hypothetical protein
MKSVMFILLFVAASGGAACADDAPLSNTSSAGQAPARQFGMLFGGTATQYDLCVKKGFIAKGDQSAEAITKSILEKMRQFNKWTDQTAYVQEGWDAMKQDVAKHESEYTQNEVLLGGQRVGEDGGDDDT